MSFRELLNDLQAEGLVFQSMVLPAAAPSFSASPKNLHPTLKKKLLDHGYEKLFTHQVHAYDLAAQGKPLVVVTGTSSGKSLCYHLSAIQTCLTEPAARALYLFPTKALAHDQEQKLQQLLENTNLYAASYDADTPKSRRSAIRQSAHILLTNPDMLHQAILPQHELWGKFLRSLRVIVIDEMHVYRGLFGGHVAGVLWRLIRLCEWRGSHPQIIAGSATIQNPAELFEALTTQIPIVIAQDTAPKGKKALAFLQTEPHAPSPLSTTGKLLAKLVAKGLRTMAFCPTRVSSELVLKIAREHLQSLGEKPGLIENYRGGYTSKERSLIEKMLFSGKLRGLSTTSAMELGVDIGGMDAVILCGYPGTRSSFWQQVGRAGRAGREGLALFIPFPEPLEQFLSRRPEVLTAAPESVTSCTNNGTILAGQLRCAAFERPITRQELSQVGEPVQGAVNSLVESGDLHPAGAYYFLPSHHSPAPKLSIRSLNQEKIRLQLGEEALGEMELWRALRYAHPGAVYLHRGQSYLITELDLKKNIARLQPEEAEYYTQPIVQSLAQTNLVIREQATPLALLGLAALSITSYILGFRKLSFSGQTSEGVEPLDMPVQNLDTVGVQLLLEKAPADWDESELTSGLHGLEHALITVAPLLVGCDSRDLGSAWVLTSVQNACPSLFIYDQTPGGAGLSEKLFEQWPEWVSAAKGLLTSCQCQDGCPSCLLIAGCEFANEQLDKAKAEFLLETLSEPPP